MPTQKNESKIKKSRKKHTETDKPKTQPPEDTPKEHPSFPIIGIGASAGGLEAIEALFSDLPPDSNMAFVIIQHLSPTHKSVMGSLLEKYTQSKIVELEDGIQLEPNCIYLNTPNKNAAIFNGRIHLLDPLPPERLHLPIDHFFRSLAEEMGERAIGIILSGTATDGTLGLKAIKEHGGMVMVQAPESAAYDGMPRNAIATGLVDFILPAQSIAGKLMDFVKQPYIEDPAKNITNERRQQLNKICFLIRQSTGHDFSGYKQNTLFRRTQRRMAVNQIMTMAQYVRYIEKTPAERELLFKDLLIGVTNFFRNQEAFEFLKNLVIPKMINQKSTGSPIRVWVAGCSTGEEAYSLAILFLEVMDETQKHCDLQIFASDIDAETIEQARTGVYPDSIAVDVSAERLNRFFVKEDNKYRVKPAIREKILFSIQDLTKDPPFSKLDMLSCRNLLIYLETELQKKIISLFHYALNEKGILFLGSSESIGEFTHLFKAIEKKWKIFQQKAHLVNMSLQYNEVPFRNRFYPAIAQEQKKQILIPDLHNLAKRIVLDNYAYASVMIDKKYDIHYLIGPTGDYLNPPKGRPRLNILAMVGNGLRIKLSALIKKAVIQKKTIVSEELQIEKNNNLRTFHVIVRPIHESTVAKDFLLVIFRDKTTLELAESEKDRPGPDETSDPFVSRLRSELQATREYLQSTTEELESSNEELKSTNEELQSANEELQSTNEELETSKEELQSTNEELITVNSELQKKVEELSVANNDITNLLTNSEIGTIFLDTNLCIRRFTPRASKLFNLIQSDVGRPISDITTKIVYDNLKRDSMEVLDTLVRLEHELQDKEGNWFSIRILPYRTIENVIDGVVITFMDINKLKEADHLRRLATIVKDSNDAITIQDFEGQILAWNKGAEKMYGYRESEALAMNIKDIIPDHKTTEALTLIKRLSQGEVIESFETQRKHKNGRLHDIWLTATLLYNDSGERVSFATTERDISNHKKIEQERQHLATFVDASQDAIIIQDLNGHILTWNHSAELMYGYSKTEALKMNVKKMIPQDKQAELDTIVKQLVQGKKVEPFATQRQTKAGRMIDVHVTAFALPDEANCPFRWTTTERTLPSPTKVEDCSQL